MSAINNELLKAMFTNPIIIGVLVLGIISALFYKKIVGWFGEHWTRQALSKLPKAKYKIINDLFLNVDGRTCQIDHVVVSPYGIFSVETKQYNGYIKGNKYDNNWVRRSGENKYYYTNPIKQNYGHCKMLAQLLKIDESKIYNIVCIPSKAILNVKHDGELVRYNTIFDKISSYNDEIIDDPDDIYKTLLNSNIKASSLRKNHIANIRNKVGVKDINKCPKCGGLLIERE